MLALVIYLLFYPVEVDNHTELVLGWGIIGGIMAIPGLLMFSFGMAMKKYKEPHQPKIETVYVDLLPQDEKKTIPQQPLRNMTRDHMHDRIDFDRLPLLNSKADQELIEYDEDGHPRKQ